MKKKSPALILFFLLILTKSGFTQITFQKTYGGTGNNQGYCVQQTTDGGFIIAGKSDSFGLGYTDIFIIRTDAAGDTIWTKAMGSTGIDVITSVRQATDGGFIFAGVYAPPPSYSYAFLMKTDSSGNILWTKAYGNSNSQDGRCVQQTSDGGYILCGNIVPGATSNDYMLLKTDSAGAVSWVKAYGSNSSDFAYYVEQTSDGGYVFTGWTAPVLIELIKTDMSGNLQWSKNYGSGKGNCVHQTSDGGYALLGYSSGIGLGNDDITLKKTDSSGNLLWSYRYGGRNSDRGYSFAQTADGGFILSGTTSDSGIYKLLLIKTDSTGSVLWSKSFGSSGFSEAGYVQQTTDGGYAVLGKYGSTNNSIYLVKTDSSGASTCNQADTIILVLTDSVIATAPPTAEASLFIGNVVPLMTVIPTPPSVSVDSPCFSASVLEQTLFENGFAVIPNPSNGNFNILFNKSVSSCNVDVLNVTGTAVFRKQSINTQSVHINLDNIASGIYFVKVSDGEKSYCRKLIVEK